ASCLADPGRIQSEAVAKAHPPRLALLPGFPWVGTGTEQERAMLSTMASLRDSGAMVTTVALPEAWSDAQRVYRTIMLYEAVQQMDALQARDRGRLSVKLNAALDEG